MCIDICIFLKENVIIIIISIISIVNIIIISSSSSKQCIIFTLYLVWWVHLNVVI